MDPVAEPRQPDRLADLPLAQADAMILRNIAAGRQSIRDTTSEIMRWQRARRDLFRAARDAGRTPQGIADELNLTLGHVKNILRGL